MWKVYGTDEYFTWFFSLEEPERKAVLFEVKILGAIGPELGRPHADVLHGAKRKNLKELRAETTGHVLRVAFYFDKKRNGILLTGGDKKGKNQEKFYTGLIKEAEALIEKYKDHVWE
jgi:hypothetical protein